MFILTSFASFAVDTSDRQRDIGARASITLTMVLSFSAFRIVVAEYVPAVSYLTMLDRYLLLSNVLFICVVLQNVSVVLLPREATVAGRLVRDLPAHVNTWSAVAIGGAFVAVHASLLVFLSFFQKVIASETASAHAVVDASGEALHTWRVSRHSSLTPGEGAAVDDADGVRTWKHVYAEQRAAALAIEEAPSAASVRGVAPFVRWPRSQSL